MLAYIFWHRPREGVEREDYERAQAAFHSALARGGPAGLLGSVCFRGPAPWLGEGDCYEDWYLLGDHAALGVLGEAATGRGRRSSHDRAAALSGRGAGGLYALIEGARPQVQTLAQATDATWVDAPRGGGRPELAEMLADGAGGMPVTVWRRELVLGPAPEYCVLAGERPRGTAPARLPEGWAAQSAARQAIHPG